MALPSTPEPGALTDRTDGYRPDLPTPCAQFKTSDEATRSGVLPRSAKNGHSIRP